MNEAILIIQESNTLQERKKTNYLQVGVLQDISYVVVNNRGYWFIICFCLFVCYSIV